MKKLWRWRLFFFGLIFLALLLPALAQEKAVNLAELIRLAKERNPGLKSLRDEVEVSRSRILPLQTLPNPVFSLNLRNIGLTQFTVGKEMMSGVGFSFSQMIPFPGKLRLQGEIATTRALRAEEKLRAATLSLTRQITELYSRLFYSQKAIEVLTKKKHFLEKALEAATVRYSVGQGIQADVLKAQVELTNLEEMLIPWRQMVQSIKGEINSLLDFPLDHPLPQVEEIPFYELKSELGELLAAAEKESPLLKEAGLMIEESSKEVSLARREFAPNFMIQGGKDFKGPFKDMYEIMIGVEIPLYFKRKEANNLRAAVAELSRAKNSLEAMRNELQAMINESYLKAKSAEKLISLTRQNLLPQASLTLESTLVNYQVSKVDFLTLLSAIDSLFSYEMEYYHQLSELWMATSRLEELTSLTFFTEENKDGIAEETQQK